MHRRWLVLGAMVAVGMGCAKWRPWGTKLHRLHAGGQGPPTLVLLHGYGSSAEHWLPYASTIAFPARGRFLFPEGTLKVPREDGALDGHAWWDLDLAAHQRPGRLGVDLTLDDPGGLRRAAAQVRDFLAREGNSISRAFVLGGFSQGAMVSCQIAFASDEPLAALVVLSGTPINQTEWQSGMAKRQGMPIFMAHGRKDNVLPFDLAERLHQDLVNAGLEVTFVPFDGGHEIPAKVVVALGEFLGRVKQ